MTCAHPRCDTPVADHHLACEYHWRQLDVSVRNRVWKAWKHRDTNPDAYVQAAGDAARIWTAAIRAAERAGRCDNCRAPALGTDEQGRTLCLVCARAELAPLRGATLTCARCNRTVDVLASVDTDEPTLCLDCVNTTLVPERTPTRSGAHAGADDQTSPSVQSDRAGVPLLLSILGAPIG